MLDIKKYIVLFSVLTALVSCEIDNFAQPNCTISGKIVYIDEESGEEMPFQAQNGSDYALVRIYEDNINYPSPTAEYIPIYANGTFYKSMMPETSYKVDTYMCPHVLLNGGESVTLSPNEEATIKLECIPYLVIELTDEGENNLGIKITKPAALDNYDLDLDGNLEVVRFVYGISPSVNVKNGNTEAGTLFSYTFTGTGGNAQYNALNNKQIVSMEKFVSTLDGELSLTDGMYYFRVSARISGADTDEENHSNTVYAKFDSSLLSTVE